MKRFIFYIALFLMIFGFGVCLTKLYYIWHIQFRCKSLYATLPPAGSGRGAAFESFDGEKLESEYSIYFSKRSAQADLQNRLMEAVNIIERQPLYNETGDRIGERVIAMFPPNEKAKEGYVSIIKLENDQLFEIASTSLRHAIAFENGAPQY